MIYLNIPVGTGICSKQRILDILCLDFSLDGVSLCPTMKKPFDILAEGLISKQSRGDWTPIELFLRGAAAIEQHILRFIIIFVQHAYP
jgi:hypothetical protein